MVEETAWKPIVQTQPEQTYDDQQQQDQGEYVDNNDQGDYNGPLDDQQGQDGYDDQMLGNQQGDEYYQDGENYDGGDQQ